MYNNAARSTNRVDVVGVEPLGCRRYRFWGSSEGVIEAPSDGGRRRSPMGTCPKCKQRIRRNGNHIKLGSTWFHKACPLRPLSAKK